MKTRTAQMLASTGRIGLALFTVAILLLHPLRCSDCFRAHSQRGGHKLPIAATGSAPDRKVILPLSLGRPVAQAWTDFGLVCCRRVGSSHHIQWVSVEAGHWRIGPASILADYCRVVILARAASPC